MRKHDGGEREDPTGRIPATPAPSWANDPPPPTVPLLPPIRSAHDSGGQITASRAPVVSTTTTGQSAAVPQATKRDLSATATNPDERQMVNLDAEQVAPLIIPGNPRTATPRPMFQRRYPRSYLTNLIVFVGTACVALVALFNAAPLTLGANANSGFATNAVSRWVLPTATPSPTPTPKPAPVTAPSGGGGYPNPGTAAIISDIESVFGGYSSGALAIARCESGYDPNAWNPIAILGSHASGVFQILYPITWDGTAEAGQSPYNASANILAAHEIFSRDGNSWREWACQP